MNDLIINKNTIAIKKEYNKIIIYNVEKVQVINKTLNKYLNDNCLLYGSNLNGRISYAKNILNKSYKVPIIISDNIIFLPINSIRKDICYLIAFDKIIDYKEKNNMLVIKCTNNYEFEVNISKYCLEKLIIYAIKINNYLKWSKRVKFV